MLLIKTTVRKKIISININTETNLCDLYRIIVVVPMQVLLSVFSLKTYHVELLAPLALRLSESSLG